MAMVQELPVVKQWTGINRCSFPMGSAMMKNRHYCFIAVAFFQGNRPETLEQTGLLVDMAKAEALDAIGELQASKRTGSAASVAGMRYCDLRRAQCYKGESRVSISIK